MNPDMVGLAVFVTDFWRGVDKSDESGCHPWTGYRDDDGYGRVFFMGRMRNAHELALTFTTGEVRDPSLDTCHSCDNPPCCNPRHLRFDTRASNVAEMVKRGRTRNQRLSDAQVQTIRVRAASGATGVDLAAEFGVSVALVSEIVNGNRRVTAGGPIRSNHGASRKGIRHGR